MAKKKQNQSKPQSARRSQMKAVLIIAFFSIVSLAVLQSLYPRRSSASTSNRNPLQQATAISTNDIGPDIQVTLLEGDDGLNLMLTGFEFRSLAGRREPSADMFLIVFGDLQNTTNRDRCAYARDLRLYLDGDEYRPQNGAMGDIQDTLTRRIDYLGAYSGQCVEAGEDANTFAVFDVPVDVDHAELVFFDNERIELLFDWPAATPGSDGIVIALGATDTPQPQPTRTRPPTHTPVMPPATDSEPTEVSAAFLEITDAYATRTAEAAVGVSFTQTIEARWTRQAQAANTSRPTNTPRPQSTTYYINSTTPVNARPCARLNNTCAPVTSFAPGEAVQVIGTATGDLFAGSETWNSIQWQGQVVYVHSSFLSRNRPPTPRPPSNTGSSGGGSTSGNTGGNTGGQAQPTTIPRPGNCATAVAMGLTAQQAAQWSHLDRDGDGVACYGD